MAHKKRKDSSISLSSWRELDPTRALQAHKQLIELVAPLTAFPEAERQLLTKAVVDSNAADAQLKVAVRLEQHHRKSSDLSRSWLLIAASGYGLGASRAAMLLGILLIQVAGNVKRFDASPLEADRVDRLGSEWMKQAIEAASLGSTIEDVRSIVAGPTESKRPMPSAENLTSKEATPKLLHEPQKVVIREIGISQNGRDDQAFVEAWRTLTKPLRLAVGPRPDLLKAVLTAEFPWLHEAIDKIVNDLVLRRSTGLEWVHWRPILLVGPPGSGKTRFARRVAELVKTGFGEVNAAGSSDNRALQGTARGWSSASPSAVLHVMRQSKTANPVVLVDEIDKVSNEGSNGDIRATLLMMLERTSAKAWPDEALMVAADLSAVNWILAANDVAPLRGPLLTRLRVVEAPVPTEQHYPSVMAALRRDLADELGVRIDDLPEPTSEVEALLMNAMRRRASLRRVSAAFEASIQAAGGLPACRRTN